MGRQGLVLFLRPAPSPATPARLERFEHRQETGGKAMARQTKDSFDALLADPDRHRLLLKKLGKEDAAPEDRVALFEEFTRELKGHAAAEEQALYSVSLAKPDTTDKARHSVAEHKEIEDMLNHLATVDVSSGEWMEKFEDLRDEYIHHIDEEEEE